MMTSTDSAPTTPLLQVRRLTKHYPISEGALQKSAAAVKAVDDISFDIREGETLGLVGESGCGKTTAGRCILRLIEPTSGQVFFDGQDLLSLSAHALRERRRDMQLIFQDPFASLNPRMTVGQIVREPLVIHNIGTRKEQDQRVGYLLESVGLDPKVAGHYPHEFSGGQRQRVGIARALALGPKFIVADEPVSALDVSVQAQVVNLLQELQEKLRLTYLFISHGLPVVKHISTRVAVMYLGKIVEIGSRDDIYSRPAHPYTRALLASTPVPDPSLRREHVPLRGEVPSPVNPPSGCTFHPRCPFAIDECKISPPSLYHIGEGHRAACFLERPEHDECIP